MGFWYDTCQHNDTDTIWSLVTLSPQLSFLDHHSRNWGTTQGHVLNLSIFAHRACVVVSLQGVLRACARWWSVGRRDASVRTASPERSATRSTAPPRAWPAPPTRRAVPGPRSAVSRGSTDEDGEETNAMNLGPTTL